MTAPMRVLFIECEGATLPDLAATSDFGPFEADRVQGLEDAASRLATDRFDAIAIGVKPVDARALLKWPGLSQAVADPAFIVLVTQEPGADLAVRLVQRGVQDVLPLGEGAADALARSLRLGVERKQLEQAARKAYATDLMTGLPNQGQLVEHINQLLALREREPAPMALLALRIEGLATAEAALGRESANVLRRKIAVRLRAGVRASDVVSSTGADSFAVLLSRFQDVHDADRVATKLLTSLHPPFALAGRDVAVAAAIGIAHHPADGGDAASLLRRATGLAAAAPAQGRDGFANREERGGNFVDSANDPFTP